MGTKLVYNHMDEIKGEVTEAAMEEFLDSAKIAARSTSLYFILNQFLIAIPLYSCDKQMRDTRVFIL